MQPSLTSNLLLTLPMMLDASIRTQARQLFLAEALELCQQFEERLLLLNPASAPLALETLTRQICSFRQGADQVGLPDLQHLSTGLDALLEVCAGEFDPQPLVQVLLHPLGEVLRLSLIAHRSSFEETHANHPYDFAVHVLLPKALEMLEPILNYPLPTDLQAKLLQQMLQWLQWWSEALDLTELLSLTTVTLQTLQTFPQTVHAVFPVALAGFQVAYRGILQKGPDPLLAEQAAATPLLPASVIPPSPPDNSTAVLEVSGYLVGLAHQTIFCVATEHIAEIVLSQPKQVLREGDQEYLLWRDRRLQLLRFADLWHASQSLDDLSSAADPSELILVIRRESQYVAVAIEVDRLIVDAELPLGQPDVAVAPLPPGCYGWTRLNGGPWMTVVDVNALCQGLLIEPILGDVERATDADLSQTLTTAEPKTILVVDDSKMVREVLAMTLQEAGYQV
ncbi:MAG: hypothetical protein WCD18_13930, partial [Thermosynechococcaceae cyanobacterium]